MSANQRITLLFVLQFCVVVAAAFRFCCAVLTRRRSFVPIIKSKRSLGGACASGEKGDRLGHPDRHAASTIAKDTL